MENAEDNSHENLISDCCKSTMIPPDWEAAENAGSLYRAYVCYICNNCGKPCEPIIQEK